jgi:peptide-methionine (R)-S-oxide reductase
VASEKVVRSDVEWRAILSDEEYRVMREHGTELPFSGEHNLNFNQGEYRCKGCDTVLFDSNSKFDSHCGWPSFDRQVADGAIKEIFDSTHGMIRTEVVCAKCESHLGHVFPDGPTETGQRYCVNSASLNFTTEKD